ncbi:SRPBCC domain-containing protein [Dyella sp. BiH032]|uniref:SRPBCC family protein n=1 Tax=Dyella sp. BiH032 TaxID=3075430 RepID=UPI002892AAA3|nr:SRPBCC domain-containing protein [Dyella sp. BiH032]WNL46474.1 SRPBCC domain-containing protein [Dyella sp. BiH032]
MDVLPPHFMTDPVPGFDGMVHCRIVEAVEPARLVYTWKGGPIDTVVSWTLTPLDGNRTLLRLKQDGFRPEDEQTRQVLEQGWRQKAPRTLSLVVASLM